MANGNPRMTYKAMLTRFFRLQLGKVHHRLFLLEEYWRGSRGGPMPAHLAPCIVRRPADAEDWVHLLRFIGPEESVFLVDVGAHVGNFTADFLACYEDGAAVCLEPVRATFERLEARFAGNPRVTCLNYAAGDRDGDVEMSVYPGKPALNSFHRYEDGVESIWTPGAAQREIVACRTLPSVVALPEDRTVIVKIDVQGHEMAVCNGGGAGWFSGVDAVLCEVSFCPEYAGLTPSFAHVSARLMAHDLYPIVFQSYGQTISNYAIERDVLFVHRTRLDRILFRDR